MKFNYNFLLKHFYLISLENKTNIIRNTKKKYHSYGDCQPQPNINLHPLLYG